MSGDASLRVYVDSRAIDVPKSATVLEAIEIADASLAAALREGSRSVTDSRGLPIASDASLHGGAILRVVAARHDKTG